VWRYVKSKLYGAALILAAIGGAVSPAVAVAASEIQASICVDFMAPTITSPVSGFATQDDSVIVTGEGEASLPITIVDNGTPLAITTVSSSGDYAISIPLSVGENVIIAREVNACGTAKESGEVHLQRNAVPQAPTGGSTLNQESVGVASIASVGSAQDLSSSLNQPIPNNVSTASFNAPVIKQPLPDTVYTTNLVWVTGTAEPSSMVTIYINGMSVARLRASPTGSFSVTVELNKGRNTIQVEAEKDGKSALSQSTTVTYTPPKSAAKGTSPFAVATAIAAGLAIAMAVITSDVWVVKLIKARRLR